MDKWINEYMNRWRDAEYYDLLKENKLNSDFCNAFMIRYNSW